MTPHETAQVRRWADATLAVVTGAVGAVGTILLLAVLMIRTCGGASEPVEQAAPPRPASATPAESVTPRDAIRDDLPARSPWEHPDVAGAGEPSVP